MLSEQKALFLVEQGGSFEVRTRDIQEPGPGEVLVEIHATALNPVDWKIQAYDFFLKDYPAIVGTDAAGMVKKFGEGVSNVVVGDRVYVPARSHAGFVSESDLSLHQGFFDNRRATFQQYTIVPADIVAKVQSFGLRSAHMELSHISSFADPGQPDV